jgi:hypothetical protein
MQWRIYWDYKQENIIGGEARQGKLRQRSWADLQILFATIRLDNQELISSASNINDSDLVPIVALAIKDQYENEVEFYDDCMEFLVDNPELLTAVETGETVLLNVGKQTKEPFLIYNPMHSIEDYTLEATAT